MCVFVCIFIDSWVGGWVISVRSLSSPILHLFNSLLFLFFLFYLLLSNFESRVTSVERRSMNNSSYY